MRAKLLLSSLALALGATAGEPTRRPLEGPPARGWARVTLDADAQRQRDGLWISDETGRSVPFLEVRRGHLDAAPAAPASLRLGTTDKGLPTAAFQVPPAPGGHRLRFQVAPLDLPWVARLEGARQGPGGAWVGFSPEPRPHVWQLRTGAEGLLIHLPDEPGAWRFTLRPVVGRAPRLTGLTLQTLGHSWSLEQEARLPLTPEPAGARTWRLSVPAGEAVHRLEVRLRPPVAPLAAELLEPLPDHDGRPAEPRLVPHGGALWALPAFDSQGTRLELATPFRNQHLLLRLPEGAEPLRVEAICARVSLAFPTEPDHTYFLHAGGAAKPAPGDLTSLAAGFDPDQAVPRTLGAAQADPHAVVAETVAPSVWERTRRAWPWIIGAVTLLLAGLASRLLRPATPGEP